MGARYRDVVVRSPVLAMRRPPALVLLGDAAHAMSPQLGLGASFALADAWALAACLRSARRRPLSGAAPGTTRHRGRRTSATTRGARGFMTPVFQSDLVPIGWARDAADGADRPDPLGSRPVRHDVHGRPNLAVDVLATARAEPSMRARPAHGRIGGHDSRAALGLRHRRRRLGRLRLANRLSADPRTASSSSRPGGPTTASTSSSTCRPRWRSRSAAGSTTGSTSRSPSRS